MPQAGAPHAEAEYLLPCMLCSLYIASFRCLTKNEMPKGRRTFLRIATVGQIKGHRNNWPHSAFRFEPPRDNSQVVGKPEVAGPSSRFTPKLPMRSSRRRLVTKCRHVFTQTFRCDNLLPTHSNRRICTRVRSSASFLTKSPNSSAINTANCTGFTDLLVEMAVRVPWRASSLPVG